MRFFKEHELREVYADIYNFIFNDRFDSDYAYYCAKLARETEELVWAYYNSGYLFKWYKSLIKECYKRKSIISELEKRGLLSLIPCTKK